MDPICAHSGPRSPNGRCHAAHAQTVYPIDRAEILAGATFDFKVEFAGKLEPGQAQVTVNGEPADDDYVVRPGDEIEFRKAAGVKGQAI